MFYDFTVAVPAGTPESAPVIQDLPLTYGVIHYLGVLFPPGPHGMVRVRILDGLHQVLPSNPDGYLASDDEVVRVDEYYELFSEPYTLRVIASSPGTIYPHTISIRVGVLSPEVLQPQAGLGGLMQKFLNLVGIK